MRASIASLPIKDKKRPCFFCFVNEATQVFGLTPPAKWPEPIQDGTVFASCDYCIDMPTNEMARLIGDHINNLRREHNRKILAAKGVES